ncbi:beta-1,3-N-acetylglucosaminyltransferase lunatic fringe-like [Sycon ciliatum]|uniref:beta-1,3-N-acetylglucosaminyltransferase lunatic fringe-like n=1 Tax=Sycon ciliatum TaxID=27933 RepID=UPI0031F624B7
MQLGKRLSLFPGIALVVAVVVQVLLLLAICRSATGSQKITIAVKTSQKNHKSRIALLLRTWLSESQSSAYVFTDAEDTVLSDALDDRVFVTDCGQSHQRADLCCKTWRIIDWYVTRWATTTSTTAATGVQAAEAAVAGQNGDADDRWLCLVDDDTYVNIPVLQTVLENAARTSSTSNSNGKPSPYLYVGKPSVAGKLSLPPMFRMNYGDAPIDKYWFGTGGAGVCMNLAVARRLHAFIVGMNKTLVTLCGETGCPDDMTLGVVMEVLLGVPLRVSTKLHSHLESLRSIGDPTQEATLSYNAGAKYTNTVNAERLSKALPVSEDPSRLLSVHCSIHPTLEWCPH